MPRGNRTEKRGRKTRLRFSLAEHKDAAQSLQLIAWGRYGRPTEQHEDEAVLAALILEERGRIAAAAPTPLSDDE